MTVKPVPTSLSNHCSLCGVFLVTMVVMATALDSACSRDSRPQWLPGNMAACAGTWQGHVRNGSNLCAPGWEVCDWNTHARDLRRVGWKDALSIDGCYAYNAAQDGGRCRECRSDLEQDDLAGVGRGCPHQNKGQTSCIRGGRIDASCCVDSHISFNRACQQQPGIDGVLCCKQPAHRTVNVARPLERMEVFSGSIFLLNCPATGVPLPRVQWYKDGAKIATGHSRISVLATGDLLVTVARKSDSGQYSCEVINEEGIDMASFQVAVREHASGCRDATTEGLSIHKNVHACAGRWKGHVKQGKVLCRSGWHVCSNHHEEIIKELSWLDIFDLKGCYAYNAENRRGKCRRCHKGPLAGVGRNCGRVKYTRNSCLAEGRIDVFKSRDKVSEKDSCSYNEDIMTGVLCCKGRKRRRPSRPRQKPPHCELGCENGGVCMGHNLCLCPVGYKGAMCQNAVCNPGCGRRARCVSPGKCECISPYTGENCQHKRQRQCSSACLNGGRCRSGRCKCPPTHYGSSCQHLYKHILLTHLNRTER